MQLNWLYSKQAFNHEHRGKKKQKNIKNGTCSLIVANDFFFLSLVRRCCAFLPLKWKTLQLKFIQTIHETAVTAWLGAQQRLSSAGDAQIPSSCIYKRMKLMIITEISGWVEYMVAEDTPQRSLGCSFLVLNLRLVHQQHVNDVSAAL